MHGACHITQRMILVPVITMALSGLWGCENSDLLRRDQVSQNPSGVFDFDSGQDSDPEVSQQAVALAQQSQRDIESFLAQQSPPAAVPEARSAPIVVQFNEPGGSSQITPNMSAPVGAPATTDPPTIANAPAHPDEVDSTTIKPQPVVATVEPGPLSIDGLDNHMQGVMVQFTRELYYQSTRSAMPVRELMLLAALAMVDPSRTVSPEAMPDLTDDERRLLTIMQEHFIQLGESLDGSQDATEAVRTMVAQLQQALSEEPELSIGEAVLCTRVRGFGDYDELDLSRMVAHRSQQAVLYIEIDSFSSELNAEGQWVTVTSQQLTIYSDRDGIPVWQEEWRTAIDRSRQRRSDFFTVQLLSLPEALSVGRYQLKIRLRDDKSGAETERSIPFTLLAQPGLGSRNPVGD